MRPRIGVLLCMLCCAGAFLIPVEGLPTFPPLAAASAEEPAGWRKEFDDICGRTMDAQGMTMEELTQLVSRCDKLRGRIEKLEESERKVFLRRLQMCSDLYKYVLDWKRENNK